jgi:transposase InsO family protein
VEAAVLAVRAEHPVWGGRKIARVVERDGVGPVAASTVTGILKRHGVELGQHGGGAHPFIRFEHEAPNDLWQMDFKGHVPLLDGRLHPLTVLDDHSRFAVALEACADETGATVKALLIKAFRRYGLPWRMAVDNGPPWGDAGHGAGFTKLGVWLVEAGVALSHSRPRHPQTLGKDERFHRSLAAEALGRPFADLAKAQAALDAWRNVYNLKRPHDALAGGVPIDHYTPSPRPFPKANGNMANCSQCLRTPVRHLSGPNTPLKGEGSFRIDPAQCKPCRFGATLRPPSPPPPCEGRG